jgi:RNA polymerase sigma-70 factor, ECF subfamily
MTRAEQAAARPRPADAAAFVELLEPILPAAYRLAFGMLRSEADAEDAVQEAALNAWRGFHRFRPDADLRPWFLTIVANRCRSLRRTPWHRVLKLAQLQEPATAAPGAADVIDLRRALDGLPHADRLLLVLRFYLDLSYDEVGAVIGTSAKAAKSRTHRALARLRLAPEVSSS